MYLNFKRYLEGKGIEVTRQFQNTYRDLLTIEKAREQINAIHEFHEAALGYYGIEYNVINNKIGKTVEKYKTLIKNFKKTITRLDNKSCKNSFEDTLMESSEVFLKRAEDCMHIVEENNYLELVKRSMEKNEICLTDTYFNNLKKEEKIQVASIDKCSYNMIEMDGVYFIRKAIRSNAKLDYNEIIQYFCRVEGLSFDSVMFIKALCAYPHEYMRYCERYRLNKDSLNLKQYENKFKLVIARIEGNMLVGDGIW